MAIAAEPKKETGWREAVKASAAARSTWKETGKKRCPRCGKLKPLTKYTIRRSGPRKGHPVAHCHDCDAPQVCIKAAEYLERNARG